MRAKASRCPDVARDLKYGAPTVKQIQICTGGIQTPVFPRVIALRLRGKLPQLLGNRSKADRAGNRPAQDGIIAIRVCKCWNTSSAKQLRCRRNTPADLGAESERQLAVGDRIAAGCGGKLTPRAQPLRAKNAKRGVDIG